MMMPETPPAATQHGGRLDVVRQPSYAWLGAFDVVREEIDGFYQRCVAHGEQTMRARRSTAPSTVPSKAPEAMASQPIDVLLDRTGLATKSEINALIERLDALSREIDALADQRHP